MARKPTYLDLAGGPGTAQHEPLSPHPRWRPTRWPLWICSAFCIGVLLGLWAGPHTSEAFAVSRPHTPDPRPRDLTLNAARPRRNPLPGPISTGAAASSPDATPPSLPPSAADAVPRRPLQALRVALDPRVQTPPMRAPPAADWAKYPSVDLSYPGLRVVHAEPPIILVDNFLSDAECDHLLEQQQSGAFDDLEVDYNANQGHVMLDWGRLQLLLLVPWLAALPHVLQGISGGASRQELVLSAAGIVGATSVGLVGLLGAVVWGMDHVIGGKVFTGHKWALDAPSMGADPVYDQFLARLERVLQTRREAFEVPLLTRYAEGDRQLVHDDARRPGSKDFAAFMRHGGQREVQSVVYLKSLPPAAGGGTKFHDPVFKGLTIQPRKGTLLLFFPSFRDGAIDERMPHSGEVVRRGAKWILNTWKTQQEVPGRNRR